MRRFLKCAALLLTLEGCAARAPVAFTPRVIDENVEGAYLTALGDVNADGKTDIILLSVRSKDVLWYENPNWTRRTLVSGVSLAAVGAAVDSADKDAPRIVILTGFHRDDYEKNSGELILLRGGTAPGEAFIFAREPAAHRAAFGDIDGDGERELVVAPLSGAGGGPPIDSGAATPLLYYRPPRPERHVISEWLAGTVHGLTLVRWDGDERDDILTAGLDGVFLHRLVDGGKGALEWRSERLTPGRSAESGGKPGAGDIRVGRLKGGERFLATIESVHGGEVAVYRADDHGVWRRQLIDRGFELAHGFALADLDGDGGDEIIVSDSRGDGGVFYYSAKRGVRGLRWRRRLIDDAMAAGACEAADLDGDQRIDLVCAGMETRSLKLYAGARDD